MDVRHRRAESGATQLCTRPGGITAQDPSVFTITWKVAASTPAGSAKVGFVAQVAGEADSAKADNLASLDYAITKPPAAGLRLRTYRYPASQARLAEDGKPLVVHEGVSAVFGVDGTNSGSSSIRPAPSSR
ncbi:MAG: hypothetical protein U0P45_02995 [Acidimicrobiales bacterium]